MQLTQPISGWIEASRSYVNRGWTLLSRDTVGADGDGSNQGDDQATEMVFARLRHPGNNTEPLEAYLHFATVSADGSLQPPPTAASSLGKRIKRRLGIPDAEDAEPAALLHLWAVSDQKLSAAQVRGLRGEFVRHRQALAEMLSDNPLSASTELGEPAR